MSTSTAKAGTSAPLATTPGSSRRHSSTSRAPASGRSAIACATASEAVARSTRKRVWCGTKGSSTACGTTTRSEEHTSELQSHSDLVCRLLLEKKKIAKIVYHLT